MPELREIVPRPARIDKVGRCAEGPSVKTMLHDHTRAIELRKGIQPIHRKFNEFAYRDVPGQLDVVNQNIANADQRRTVCSRLNNADDAMGESAGVDPSN